MVSQGERPSCLAVLFASWAIRSRLRLFFSNSAANRFSRSLYCFSNLVMVVFSFSHCSQTVRLNTNNILWQTEQKLFVGFISSALSPLVWQSSACGFRCLDDSGTLQGKHKPI